MIYHCYYYYYYYYCYHYDYYHYNHLIIIISYNQYSAEPAASRPQSDEPHSPMSQVLGCRQMGSTLVVPLQKQGISTDWGKKVRPGTSGEIRVG